LVSSSGAAAQPALADKIAAEAIGTLQADPKRLEALDFETFAGQAELQKAADAAKPSLAKVLEECLAGMDRCERADGVPRDFVVDCNRGSLRSIDHTPVGPAGTHKEQAARTEKIIGEIKDKLFGPGKEELSAGDKRLLAVVTYALSQGALGATAVDVYSALPPLRTDIDGRGTKLSFNVTGHHSDLMILKGEDGKPSEARLHFDIDVNFNALSFMGKSLKGDPLLKAGAGHFEIEMNIDLNQPWDELTQPEFTLSCKAGPARATGLSADGKAVLPLAMRGSAPAAAALAKLGQKGFDGFMEAMARIGAGRPAALDIAMKSPPDIARAAAGLHALGQQVQDAVGALDLDGPGRQAALRAGFEAALRNVPGLAEKIAADPD
ncbi:MAG: hypothetical protein HUK26_09800, partial [Duodenibacillus sp.]|nr:hypothetical protein [Duodenibacillus sp.]